MEPIFSRVNWENLPSRATPINETNLNKSDAALRTIDDRVVELDTVKADKTTVNGLVKSVSLNEVDGVLTIEWLNGTIVQYDTALEKIAVNFNYDPDTEELILYDVDGQVLTRIDLSGLIIPDNFQNDDHFTWTVTTKWDAAHKHKERIVTLSLIKGSITEDDLQANYLADITEQANHAEQSADNAADSESDAAYDAQLSQSYAIGGSGIRDGEDTDNSKYYKEQAYNYKELARQSSSNAGTYERESEAWAVGQMDGADVSPTEKWYHNNSKYYSEQSADSARSSANSATDSADSAHNASVSEGNAYTSSVNAADSEANSLQYSQNSQNSAGNAAASATQASVYAYNASVSEQNAKASENTSTDNALDAEAWARGTKNGVDVGVADEHYNNNSRYYASQASASYDNTVSVYEDTLDVKDQINTMLQMAEFDVNADGFLVYTENSGFVFTVDNDGMLNWEVA